MYFYCFSYFFSLAAIAARWSPLTQLACVASSFPAQYAHSMPSVRYRILASRANPDFIGHGFCRPIMPLTLYPNVDARLWCEQR